MAKKKTRRISVDTSPDEADNGLHGFPFTEVLSQVVKGIKDQLLLFIIAMVILLITLTMSAVRIGSSNFRFAFTVITGIVVTGIFVYIYKENLLIRSRTQVKLREKTSFYIFGNVFFDDETPVKGATITIDGDNRDSKSSETGYFTIKVDYADSWTIRAQYQGQSVKEIIKREGIDSSVKLILKRETNSGITKPEIAQDDKGGLSLEEFVFLVDFIAQEVDQIDYGGYTFGESRRTLSLIYELSQKALANMALLSSQLEINLA